MDVIFITAILISALWLNLLLGLRLRLWPLRLGLWFEVGRFGIPLNLLVQLFLLEGWYMGGVFLAGESNTVLANLL